MEENKISDKFKKGLIEYGLSFEEIKEWKYCGGNKGRHANYFKIAVPNEQFPPKENKCVCGHDIIENCYITKDNEILVLGNCCIKRFIPKSGRTCEICGNSHRNRKHNICNNCLEGKCFKCLKPTSYRFCNNCFKGYF